MRSGWSTGAGVEGFWQASNRRVLWQVPPLDLFARKRAPTGLPASGGGGPGREKRSRASALPQDFQHVMGAVRVANRIWSTLNSTLVTPDASVAVAVKPKR